MPATTVGNPATSLVAAAQTQADIMTAAINRASERGYCVMLSRMNNDMKPQELRFPYGYLAGAINQMLLSWNETYGTRILTVWVHCTDPIALLDGSLNFSCVFPRRTWSQEFVGALQLIASFAKHVPGSGRKAGAVYKGSGLFYLQEKSDEYVVTGVNKPALEAFLRMLELPATRNVLLARR